MPTAPALSFCAQPARELPSLALPALQPPDPLRARKFALLIHVDPDELRVLGKMCQYCSRCEFIIAHQDEFDAESVAHFEQTRPSVIGSDYLVLGTVERKTWREGMEQPKTLDQVLAHTADFREYLEIEYAPGGWYPADEKEMRAPRRSSRR